MKKILYPFLVVFLIISTVSIPVSGRECGVNNASCMRKKLTVEKKIVGILRGAAVGVIEKVDDSYMKNTLTTLFESCSEKPEIDDSAVAGGAADKILYELTEAESQSRCYLDLLSNSFIIDLSPEEIVSSTRKFLSN